MTSSPTTFDPALLQDEETMEMLQQVFEGLVQWTPDNKIAPALAQSWAVSKDGRTYTFKIRPNVKFQDGRPLTAQDVVYSLTRSLNPQIKSPDAMTYMNDIVGSDEFSSGKAPTLAGVKAVDPMTVAITIKKPKAYWICTLTYPTAYILSSAEASDTAPLTADNVAAGAGTGPFKLAQYLPDQKVNLVKNAAYWNGAPPLPGQQWIIEKDAGTRHDLYMSGKVDITDEQPGDWQHDLQDATLAPQVHFWPRAATSYIALNQGGYAAFHDVRVRQALAYATDKRKIVQVVMNGRAEVAQDFLPDGMPGFDKGFQGLGFDPARARALLAAAGYPGGKGLPPIPVSYSESNPASEKTVDLVRQMWGDTLGVQVKAVRTQWSVLLQKEDSGTLPAYSLAWVADYLDPQDFYSALFRSGATDNRTNYSNPKFDVLCDQADVEPDPILRASLYRRAGAILANDVPVIPLFYRPDPELVKPYVTGLDDCLMHHLPFTHVKLTQ